LDHSADTVGAPRYIMLSEIDSDFQADALQHVA
jgi:hypothetical protein